MIETAIIVLTLVSFPLVAFLFQRKRGTESGEIAHFTVGSRNRNYFSIAAGISMAFVGGAATINMASLGYQYGWSILTDPAIVFFALVITAFFAGRIRTGRGLTMADLLSGASPSLKRFLGLTSFAVYQLLTAAQFVAVGKLLAPYFPQVPIELVIIVPGVIAFFYIYLRGFDAVTNTDIFQLVLMLALYAIPLLVIFGSHGGAPSSGRPVGVMPTPATLLIYLSLPFFFIPVSLDTSVRIEAASSLGHARAGLLLGGALYVLFVGLSIGIGVFLRTSGYTISQPESALAFFFDTYLGHFRIIGTVAVLAAIASTLDSFAFDSVASLSNDLLKPVRSGLKITEKQVVGIASLVVLVISLAVALVFQQILGLILGAMLLYVAIFIPVAFGRWLKVPDRSLLVSSIATMAVLVISKSMGYVPPLEPAAYIVLHLVLVLVAKAAGRK